MTHGNVNSAQKRDPLGGKACGIVVGAVALIAACISARRARNDVLKHSPKRMGFLELLNSSFSEAAADARAFWMNQGLFEEWLTAVMRNVLGKAGEVDLAENRLH